MICAITCRSCCLCIGPIIISFKCAGRGRVHRVREGCCYNLGFCSKAPLALLVLLDLFFRFGGFFSSLGMWDVKGGGGVSGLPAELHELQEGITDDLTGC